MAFYVRRFNSIGYFIGYSNSLQPMIGPPDWAIGFSSARQAYDQFPAVLHGTMEVVGEPTRAADIDPGLTRRALLFLRQSELRIEPRKQIPAGALKIYGLSGNLPAELLAEPGRVLCRWGDAGWGRLVKEDKHSGAFRDELVTAVAEMITRRWQPAPPPRWVTCVPSRRHPRLVHDFAERLAARLGLPFRAAVEKVKDIPPQKDQRNSAYQCRNLDGVFEVKRGIPDSPVLLVDDMVDSRWTVTVVASLLRQAGSGPVFPVALGMTSTNGG